MSKRRRNRAAEEAEPARASAETSSADDPAPSVRLRPWLLAGATMALVARPLLPSDTPEVASDGPLWVMIVLGLGIVWTLAAALRGGSTLRFGWVDGCAMALGLWTAAAAWVATDGGAARPAIDQMWQWIALTALFLLLRQLLESARETRAVAAVMIALGVALSAYALYQYFFSMPADRALYAANPEAALAEAQIYAPPGSPQRELFANRINSTEPMATFALTNSLAGFLCAWLTVTCGVVLLDGGVGRRRAIAAVGAALCAAPIVAALVLTKSRAAWLATLVGLALLGVLLLRRSGLRWWWAPAAFFAALAIVFAAAAAAGFIDAEVWTEAGKSLGYRLQYWRASGQMIAEYPLFGCGPGNFQATYTQYKLPDASEVVADPHNFLVEVAATAGAPAAALLCVFLALTGFQAIRAVARGESAAVDESEAALARPPGWSDASLHVFAGGVAGLVLAYLLGPLSAAPIGELQLGGCLLLFIAALFALHFWGVYGRLTAGVCGIALAALLVNLLAAGGVSFAGVAASLWLLAALTLYAARPAGDLWRPGRWAFALLLLAALGTGGASYYTEHLPVLTCAAELRSALTDPGGAEEHLKAAAAADPLSAEPWRRLAFMEWNRWRNQPTRNAYDRFLEYSRKALDLAPRTSAGWLAFGDLCMDIHTRDPGVGALQEAVAAYARAVELHPNHALGRARLAAALAEAGDLTAAAAEAQRALSLDAATPHADQKLPDELRNHLLRMEPAPN